MASVAPILSSLLLRSGFRSVLLSGLTSPGRSLGVRFFVSDHDRRKDGVTDFRVYGPGGERRYTMLLGGLRRPLWQRIGSQPDPPKLKFLKESLPKTLYDLVRAEQLVPFSIIFANGAKSRLGTTSATVRFYTRGIRSVYKTEHLSAVFGSITPVTPTHRGKS